MHTNVVFDTYRREDGTSGRQYATTKTISAGVGLMLPLTGEMRAVLGLNNAVKAYNFRSRIIDFEKYDKVTVTTPSTLAGDYYVEQLEVIDINGAPVYNMIITKDE